MSKLSNQLGAFSDYLATVRQVGHTTTMMEGVKNIDAIVVTHNENMGKTISDPNFQKVTPYGDPFILKKRTHGSKIKTITIQSDLNKLRGMQLPMVFDNAALYVLFSQASVALDKLEMENITLSRDIAISCEANYQLRKEIANLKEKNFVLDYKIEKAKADLE